MLLKNISCTQFAGMRDRSVSLSEGINVIYGKNESGKSSLVNLISRTLFQNARLDRRSDKTFFDLYFPAAKKGSRIAADFADGKLSLETENGTYVITKEWGSEPRCTLSSPDGVIRDQKAVDEALREVLIYGEGVYSEMLLSSQRNTDSSLKTILDASAKTNAKQELTDAVSAAFAESGGVSVDAVEQAVNAKIEELRGKHWDEARSAPARKAGRWTKELGEVLKAYYALEDAEAVLEEITRLEEEADRAAAAYAEAGKNAEDADEAFSTFSRFANRLALFRERSNTAERLSDDLKRYKAALAAWPSAEALEGAKALQLEKKSRALLDKYGAAESIARELSAAEEAVRGRACPEKAEIADVRKALGEIGRLKNSLCGMNLNALIKMQGENSIEIRSLTSGRLLDASEANVAVTEAVSIVIPDVMEMVLSPADVDVSKTETEIALKNALVSEILGSYGVDSPEALEELEKSISDAKSRAENLREKLGIVLGGAELDALSAEADAIEKAPRQTAEIEKEISALCGNADLAGFIAKTEALLERYISEYTSENALRGKISDTEAELEKAQQELRSTEDIPPEYMGIADPDGYLGELKSRADIVNGLRENALTKKVSAESKLESYKENLSGDPGEEAEKARRAFEEQKALLGHWRHIAEVLAEQKSRLQSDPMSDIAESFTRYLGIISGGRVASEFTESGKLSMNVYSGDRLLDYDRLSEGTKETVSLAFRLAVLDHLFPNGRGVIVFDDPLSDMDAERAEQSIRLIKDAAQRHQVIFLTCREEYLQALGGNIIRI